MVVLYVAVAVFAAVQCTDAMTTMPTRHHGHHVHTTKEPSEGEKYHFRYDGHTHDMVVISGHNCYIMALNDVQRAQVHTSDGIKKVEISAMVLISDTTAQKVVDKAVLDHHLGKFCKGATNVFSIASTTA